ncbi:hypothetical protein LDENG_00242220 [Lucifuga dentata]|nr:hypothetical protein LDENG_00242220 [Lucifuga dentata]
MWVQMGNATLRIPTWLLSPRPCIAKLASVCGSFSRIISSSFYCSSLVMGEVELSCRAYVKMYLHACLFPRCSINGLLLSSNSAGGAVCVTDCVPLLHSHLPLAPITQLALTQVNFLLFLLKIKIFI